MIHLNRRAMVAMLASLVTFGCGETSDEVTSSGNTSALAECEPTVYHGAPCGQSGEVDDFCAADDETVCACDWLAQQIVCDTLSGPVAECTDELRTGDPCDPQAMNECGPRPGERCECFHLVQRPEEGAWVCTIEDPETAADYCDDADYETCLAGGSLECANPDGTMCRCEGGQGFCEEPLPQPFDGSYEEALALCRDHGVELAVLNGEELCFCEWSGDGLTDLQCFGAEEDPAACGADDYAACAAGGESHCMTLNEDGSVQNCMCRANGDRIVGGCFENLDEYDGEPTHPYDPTHPPVEQGTGICDAEDAEDCSAEGWANCWQNEVGHPCWCDYYTRAIVCQDPLCDAADEQQCASEGWMDCWQNDVGHSCWCDYDTRAVVCHDPVCDAADEEQCATQGWADCWQNDMGHSCWCDYETGGIVCNDPVCSEEDVQQCASQGWADCWQNDEGGHCYCDPSSGQMFCEGDICDDRHTEICANYGWVNCQAPEADRGMCWCDWDGSLRCEGDPEPTEPQGVCTPEHEQQCAAGGYVNCWTNEAGDSCYCDGGTGQLVCESGICDDSDAADCASQGWAYCWTNEQDDYCSCNGGTIECNNGVCGEDEAQQCASEGWANCWTNEADESCWCDGATGTITCTDGVCDEEDATTCSSQGYANCWTNDAEESCYCNGHAIECHDYSDSPYPYY